jgi:hypothetical protein
MKFSYILEHTLKSGKITLFTGDKEALQIEAENKKIGLNVVSKSFLKTATGALGDKKSFRTKLKHFKAIADELKEDGYTVTISYNNDIVLTVGSDANPKWSRSFTGKAIEVNSIRRMIKLAVDSTNFS